MSTSEAQASFNKTLFTTATAVAVGSFVMYKISKSQWEKTTQSQLPAHPPSSTKGKNASSTSIIRPWDPERRRPWDAWPSELPHSHQPHTDTAEWKFLNDQKYLSMMHFKIRERFFEGAEKALGSLSNAAVVIKGGTAAQFDLYDSDCSKCVFRQESYFQYLLGIVLPDCYGVLDLTRKKTILFVPVVTEDSQRWMGTRLPMSWYQERYIVDEVYEVPDLVTQLQKRGITIIHTLMGVNTDSDLKTACPPDVEGISNFKKNEKLLHTYLTELRVIKTPMEIDYLRVCCRVSSQAHVYVMRHAKPHMNERHLEALYTSYTAYFGGSRHMAYTCICASGENGAILHYGWAGRPNNRRTKAGDMCLLDMGAEYNGYCTDITRSYPVNGEFTPKQRAVYEAVLDAQEQVLQRLKPGVAWPDMHKLAERVIVQHLQTMGVLKNGSVEQLVQADMGSVFMPHGLGHFIGLNTHDVGGYPPDGPPRPDTPGVKWLRTQRVLQEGMVITVEPGLYFNEPTLQKALNNPKQAKHLDIKVLSEYQGMGGVRIEDDVLITATGCENFTVAPVSIYEIERTMMKAHPLDLLELRES